MSVRAYRIITKEVAEYPSFNLWHDDELLNFFKEAEGEFNTYQERLDESGGGTIEISVPLLEKALVEYKWEVEDYRIQAIKADIAHAKKVGDNYVLYECY